MKLFKQLLFAFVLFGVTACAGTPGKTPLTTMSDAAYLKASAEERTAYEQGLKDDTAALASKRQAELEAFLPVRTGDSKTGTTAQCGWVPGDYNVINVYPGHSPPNMNGAASEGFMSIIADKQCRPFYTIGPEGQNGEPGTPTVVRLLANVATQENMARVMAKGGFQVASSIFNGVGAAAITKEGMCGENCGMQISLDNSSASGSVAGANAGAAVDFISTQGCGLACAAVDD